MLQYDGLSNIAAKCVTFFAIKFYIFSIKFTLSVALQNNNMLRSQNPLTALL